VVASVFGALIDTLWATRQRDFSQVFGGTLSAKGRQSVIVIVYRGIAWISIDPPFATQAAVLDSMRVNDLVDAFAQAVKQARGDKRS
jgi:hypothetical protein